MLKVYLQESANFRKDQVSKFLYRINFSPCYLPVKKTGDRTRFR